MPEAGRFAPAARAGFRVHLLEREPDMMAIGGRLLSTPAEAIRAAITD
ncbi:hypothetical protein [Streptomyces sp. YKOK-I1]